MTYREFVYDVIETLKQSTDDAIILPIQVIYWTQVVANRLRAARIMQTQGGMYLSIFDADVLEDTHTPPRKYINLPAEVYDLPEERAIDYITYCIETDCCEGPPFTMINFTRTTPSQSIRAYAVPYEMPSSVNPYFYRVGERLYFLGIECMTVDCVEIGLFTALNPRDVCNLDDPLPVSADQHEVMKYQVMKLSQFSTFIPRDRLNDGAATAQASQIQVPDPIQQDQRQVAQNEQQ